MEITSGHERFKNLNSLLQQISSDSPKITLASIENFYRAGGFIALATCKYRIVGIATLVSVTKINGTTGRIEHVVVDPTHRGKGLARKLMKVLIMTACLKKFRYLDLTTEPKRIEANNLYQSFGFVRRETNLYRLTWSKSQKMKVGI
jgi:ribosomal protein S18 acetylase RimI-like enzyme